MLILKDFGRGLGIVEQLIDFLNLLSLHSLFSLYTTQQTGGGQQLYSIPEKKQDRRNKLTVFSLTVGRETEVRCLFLKYFSLCELPSSNHKVTQIKHRRFLEWVK